MKINKSAIKDCIIQGKTEDAIKLLLVLSEKFEEDLYTLAILLSGRINALNKQKINGTIADDNYEIQKNKISDSLIQILEDVDADWSLEDASFKVSAVQGEQVEENKPKKETVKTILFLAANPKDTKPLRLANEMKEIQDRLRGAKERDSFHLVQRWAVNITDMQTALMEESPSIVHFSGHGSTEGRIILEDITGLKKEVPTRALGNFFRLFKDDVHCVILNACYSRDQAIEISKHIPFVVGMKRAVLDRAAIVFSSAFYNAIGNGRDVEFAFELAKNSIEMFDIKGDDIPVLIKKQ